LRARTPRPTKTIAGLSHFQLLRAFVDDTVLQKVSAALKKHHYRTHEFGDFMLIERQFSR
jgi:S-adenosylmethionine:tRNA ribosyltransferase-isomerase